MIAKWLSNDQLVHSYTVSIVSKSVFNVLSISSGLVVSTTILSEQWCRKDTVHIFCVCIESAHTPLLN